MLTPNEVKNIANNIVYKGKTISEFHLSSIDELRVLDTIEYLIAVKTMNERRVTNE